MKKLNRWLLLNRPLIWNMRLHYVLPILLLLHLLLFLGGFLPDVRLDELYRYYRFSSADVIPFTILAAILIVLGWLVFYLRNNALKNLYPLKHGQLFLEFIVQFIILFGAISLPLSYENGRYQKIRTITHNTDIDKEAEIVATAYHLLAFDYDDFRASQDCDAPRNQGVYDSESGTVIAEADTTFALPENAQSEEISYLHFCRFRNFGSPDQAKAKALDRKVKGWLLQGQRDKVREALEDYLKLCKKYGADYNFNVADQVDEIFATPRFLVRTKISRYDESNSSPFIQTYDVERALDNVQSVQGREIFGATRQTELFIWLYAALYMAIALFSFRATRIRAWFTALIGMGIWWVIIIILAFSMGRANNGEYVMGFICFALAIVWFIFSAFNILRGQLKPYAGVAHNWWLWVLPVYFPTLLLFISELLEERDRPTYINGVFVNSYSRPAFSEWVDHNMGLIWSANLLLILLVVAFVWIPLSRKWQAMPEE